MVMTPDQSRSEPASPGVAFQTRLLWALLVIVLGGVLLAYAATRVLPGLAGRASRESELPSYGPVADFTLTDQLGRTTRRSDFDGHPWVADFIFTRCSGPCPLITNNLARLAAALGPDSPVRFASFTIDPEWDTPGVLKEYADRFGADHSRWRFLTGERLIIAAVARHSFHLAVEMPEPVDTGRSRGRAASDAPAAPAGTTAPAATGTVAAGTTPQADSSELFDIPHSLRFALVDSAGQIRGYYDGIDMESVGQLERDIERLLRPAT